MIYRERDIPDTEFKEIANSISEIVEDHNLSIEQARQMFDYVAESFSRKPMFRRVDRWGREIEQITKLELPMPHPLQM